MIQIIETKDILLHIATFLDKTQDKQEIFNLASCNHRMNNIMKNYISKHYTCVINEHNYSNIPKGYTSYTISASVDINLWDTVMANLDKQTKLDTLEFFSMRGIFWYSMLCGYETLTFGPKVHSEYFMVAIMQELKKYNIKVNRLMIKNTNTKIMEPIMDKFGELQRVSMFGHYVDCNKSYGNIKQLITKQSSLYLLKNFSNIEELYITNNGQAVTATINNDTWRSNLVLNNLKELIVSFKSNTLLDDILSIAPNVKSLGILCNPNYNDKLEYIERVLKKRSKSFVSLTEYIKLQSDDYNYYSQVSIIMISKIMHKYVNNVVTKHKNIKYVEIFSCTDNMDNGAFDYIFEWEKAFDTLYKLTGTTVYDILLYAYKVICVHCVVSSRNHFTVEFVSNINDMI